MTGSSGAGIVVQERDRCLLRELAVMRVVDREQAQSVAGFRSVTRANARLLALARAGLLNRFFVGTVNGGKKSLYGLSRRGAALVGAPPTGLKRKRDSVLVGDAFVEHQRHVNHLYIAFKFEPPCARCTFRFWRAFREPISRAVALVPDGYLEVESPEKTLSMFIEADLGTERLALWKQKVEGYLRLAVTGEFAERFGQKHFRVLVATTSMRRLHAIRSLIARSTDKIFWLATFESIRREGPWARVWFRPTGSELVALAGGTP